MNIRILVVILFCVANGFDDHDAGGGGGWDPIGNDPMGFITGDDDNSDDSPFRKRVNAEMPEELEDEKQLAKVRHEWRPQLWEFKWSWKDPWAERPEGEPDNNQEGFLQHLDNIRHDKVHEENYWDQDDPFGDYGDYGDYPAFDRFKRSLRTKRGAVHTGKCIRKEYRMFTQEEKDRYAKAIQKMKASGAYDTIGMRHRIKDAPGAHEGSAFLLWHRMYLLQFEVALQLMDPHVCLPYWDSSLDGRLGRHFKHSCMFDKNHLGTWKGHVHDGIFANFTAYKGCTKTGKVLTRSVGKNALYTSGDFIRYDKIKKFEGIGGTSRLEDDHGYVHLTIGGHMNNLNCAPCDPIFFLHHAFVDYIFFRFRRNQVGNKTTDYVAKPKKHHKLSDPMLPFAKEWNRDGLKDIPSVTYLDSPSMSVCKTHKECGSDMLWCDRERCTAKIKEDTRCVRNKHTSCYCPTHKKASCARRRKPWWWKICTCKEPEK